MKRYIIAVLSIFISLEGLSDLSAAAPGGGDSGGYGSRTSLGQQDGVANYKFPPLDLVRDDNCAALLVIGITSEESELLLDIMEMISLSDGHYERTARSLAQSYPELLLWYQMSSGFSIQPIDSDAWELKVDEKLMKMMHLGVPIEKYQNNPGTWDYFALRLLDHIHMVWTAIPNPSAKTSFADRIFKNFGRRKRIALVHLEVLDRIKKRNRYFLLDHFQSLEIAKKIERLQKLLKENDSALSFFAERLPALLQIRAKNWSELLASDGYRRLRVHLVQARNPKLSLSQLELNRPSGPFGLPSLNLPMPSNVQAPKAEAVSIDEELIALHEWANTPMGEASPEIINSIASAQALLAPLRAGSRAISDVLLAAPVPAEAKDLSEYWEQNRQDPSHIKNARKEIRKWHDLAREHTVALDKISSAINSAVELLEMRLDQYIQTVKMAAQSSSISAELDSHFSGLVQEAQLMKVNALQSRLAISSRLQRQQKWIEALVLLESISSLPQDGTQP